MVPEIDVSSTTKEVNMLSIPNSVGNSPVILLSATTSSRREVSNPMLDGRVPTSPRSVKFIATTVLLFIQSRNDQIFPTLQGFTTGTFPEVQFHSVELPFRF